MGEPVNPDNVYSQNLCKGLVSLHQQPLVLDIVSASVKSEQSKY